MRELQDQVAHLTNLLQNKQHESSQSAQSRSELHEIKEQIQQLNDLYSKMTVKEGHNKSVNTKVTAQNIQTSLVLIRWNAINVQGSGISRDRVAGMEPVRSKQEKNVNSVAKMAIQHRHVHN